MFTGIVATTAKVKKNQSDKKGGWSLVIEKPRGWKVKKGESVAVNGVCLTALVSTGGISFVYMPETASRSNLADLAAGDMVNLEHSLRLGDRLGGHIVQGHVDAVGVIEKIISEGNSRVLKIILPDKKTMSLIAEKGSVTIDGISLTVVQAEQDFFTVKIIPHTWNNTNLRAKKIGDKVNVETDMMARYLQKLMTSYAGNR